MTTKKIMFTVTREFCRQSVFNCSLLLKLAIVGENLYIITMISARGSNENNDVVLSVLVA